jgi:hypothetical protein
MSTRKVCPQKDWFNHKSIKLSNNDQFNAFIEGGYSTYGLKAGVKNLSGMLPTYYFHCKKCEGYVGTYKLTKNCFKGGESIRY